MTIGGSLVLIALGAILKYAVTFHVSGINIHVVGLILMIAGGLGLILGLFLTFSASDRTVPPPPPRERF